MIHSIRSSCALACALSLAPAAWAADPEVDAIRRELRDLREGYEARLQALERRLQEAEAKAAAAPVPAPMAAAPAQSSSISAFNPAVSVVLQGTYANLSQDPSRFAIAGFAPGGESGPGRRGLSLGESELALSANIDDRFSGNLIFSLTPEDTVAVEEAYAVYSGAPYGIVPKVGRFLSGIGYLNEQHPHAWDFVDAPLAYQAFLGGQYAQDGIQAKWLAPTEHFIELGAEAGRGAGFPGNDRDKNGAGSGAIYVHTGGDVGESHNWRAGLSYLRTRAADREFTLPASTDTAFAFTGSSRIAIADFVWKWAPNGNIRETNFKVQGEYFVRKERGELTTLLGFAPDPAAAYAARQSGWYVQGVYQPFPLWRIGARYDRLDPGEVDPFTPQRASAMVDWSPSEFSRLRLQFTRAKTVADATDNQWFVQYILSMGAHGAHKY